MVTVESRPRAGAWRVCFRGCLIGVLLIASACGGSADRGDVEAELDAEQGVAAGPLVVYSGRNKSLIEPLLERFEEQSGIEIEVRYGGTAELAATLLEEGERTPCDVFIGQDAAALGTLADAGLLRPLPPLILSRVADVYRSPDGDWVGLSGRARVVVYNSERVKPEELPQSLDQVADPRYRGRFGVAPANASFQAHMAAYRALKGGEALEALLGGMVANEARTYAKNSAIVEAVLQGEVDWGLVNHYYLWRALEEQPEAPGVNVFMSGDEISGFVNLAGAAMLDESPAALNLIAFLLSDEAQHYFAEETYEYPLVAGIEPSAQLNPLPQSSVQLDVARLAAELEPTLEAIGRSGLL